MKKGAFALLLAVLIVSFTGCYSLASSLFFGASGEETASGYAADGYADIDIPTIIMEGRVE